MASPYAALIASAVRAIRAKGELAAWLEPVAADVPGKPWNAEESAPPIEHPAHMVFFPMDRQFAQLVRYARNSDVVIGNLYALMGAVNFAPKVDWTVRRKDGKVLAPLAVDPLAPNGDIILYTVEFKT